MKVFVWQNISECTSNYHSGGGVVVFAKDIDRAIEMAADRGCKIDVVNEVPDDIRKVHEDTPEAIYIMPDAGCC